MAQGWQCWGLGAFSWRLRSASLTFSREQPWTAARSFPCATAAAAAQPGKGPIPVSASVLCAQEASSIVAWEQRPLWGQQCWWWDRAVLLWQSQCLCLFLRLPVTDG